MVSVIIPVYNEEKTIIDCLLSLSQQSYKEIEIIVVDDESTDKSKVPAKGWSASGGKSQKSKVQSKIKNLRIFSQKHQGPGPARNLGARYANGEILVFVDADMTFAEDFIKNLIDPIIKGKSKGTFTKDEYVSNWDNVWARCWNYDEGIEKNLRIPPNYPDTSPVFRAILKSEFTKIGGFDNIGFTDDWTLSRKLGYQATSAKNAVCYHRNPETLVEVYRQARWIGKNEFISGTFLRRIVSLLRFNPMVQMIRGVFITIKYGKILFPIFSLVYYCGISTSIILSFLGEKKSK